MPGVGVALSNAQPARSLGPERVTNGGFTSDLSGWTASTGGWSWSSGTAKLTGDGSAQTLQQDGVFVTGHLYQVSFDLVLTSGQIIANSNGVNICGGGTGHYAAVFRAGAAFLAFKRVSGTVTGTLDNVSVRELV